MLETGRPTLIVICLLSLLLAGATETSAGVFRWRVSGETGAYFHSGSQLADEHYQLTVLEGDTRYSGRFDRLTYKLHLQVKPEFLNSNMKSRAVKYSGSGNFRTRLSPVDLSMDFSNRRQNFHSTDRDLDLNFFRINLSADWPFRNRECRLLLNFSYFYHDLKSRVNSSLDAVIFRATLNRSVFRWGNVGVGGYFEKFSLGNSTLPQLEEDRILNLGWRNGLEFIFEYQKKYVLQFNYRLLWRYSDVLDKPASEHLFNILFGKMLGHRISIFFLGEYFVSKIKLAPELDEQYSYSALFYSSLNTVNRSNIKAAYRFSDRLEGYVKSGWVRGNYFFDDFSLSGLNLMGGVRYSR